MIPFDPSNAERPLPDGLPSDHQVLKALRTKLETSFEDTFEPLFKAHDENRMEN